MRYSFSAIYYWKLHDAKRKYESDDLAGLLMATKKGIEFSLFTRHLCHFGAVYATSGFKTNIFMAASAISIRMDDTEYRTITNDLV